MEKVYLVFEGDTYLSNDSLIFMGVYNNEDTAISDILNELQGKGLLDDINSRDNVAVELYAHYQTAGLETNYIIKSVNLNEWGEI